MKRPDTDKRFPPTPGLSNVARQIAASLKLQKPPVAPKPPVSHGRKKAKP